MPTRPLPGAPERCDDDVDNDCDGEVNESCDDTGLADTGRADTGSHRYDTGAVVPVSRMNRTVQPRRPHHRRTLDGLQPGRLQGRGYGCSVTDTPGTGVWWLLTPRRSGFDADEHPPPDIAAFDRQRDHRSDEDIMDNLEVE